MPLEEAALGCVDDVTIARLATAVNTILLEDETRAADVSGRGWRDGSSAGSS
jgi:shikimate 5-dehydrogenase